ncbi:MAG: hypothetical protein KZQ76_13930 [Candidatus Thiodiazotropha sp. (ex Epidulcina cf. delphinae)]|nr:hypothetical protein [Candidatus Thiodiazotropha sp. (ex Epidulcina cf. delphinae)]
MKTAKKLEEALADNQLKNKEKLRNQQAYYQRLSKSGVAKKQTYNLKSLSVI